VNLLDPPLEYIPTAGAQLAVRKRSGRSPTILFLPGYMSDMEGAKARAMDAFAAERGQGCVRFDYSGTGSSDGEFDQGTLTAWLADSLEVVDRVTAGPLILVGSSMGGWLALQIALNRTSRTQAIVGIAAAPDFTDWGFSEADRGTLRARGRIEERESGQLPGRFFTRMFWESGQDMLLLNRIIPLDCPVRLIHGADDKDVPVEIAHRTLRQLRSADVQLTIVKGGGHRLSEPHEIDAILRMTAGLLEPNR
jgi:pimeloyl-ACP methyl ester carboxylesterase